MKQFKENMKKNWSSPIFILGNRFLFITILVTSALIWQVIYFNTVDFEQILYNLLAPMDGANTEVFTTFALEITPIALLISIILSSILITLTTDENGAPKKTKWNDIANFVRKHYLTVNILLFVVVAAFAFVKIGGVSYVWNHYFDKSVIYEEEYKDPEKVKLTFPDEKRNLIYIFCESMENSFMSEEYGGAQEENYIPELTKLMEENTSFYNPGTQNGAVVTYNCDWTVAAMTAHTSSIPLVLPMGENEENYTSFLPGVTSLGDILKEQGQYYICDLGSTNGTYLCGKRIQPGVKEQLTDGMIIEFANSKFKVHID